MNPHNQAMVEDFCEKLKRHAEKKACLYDGADKNADISQLVMYLAEEVGEVSSALTRDRPILARYECLDVAHCAFLIYSTLMQEPSDRPL